jgi:hypothetical protein
MNIKNAIKAFEKDPTFFLRHRPQLHVPLIEITKTQKPEAYIEGMPLYLVPKDIIQDAIAVAPHGLLFISDAVDKKNWVKIARHEKKEIELVQKGYTPEEAHRIALASHS